jgi:hypothetical protein
MSQKPWIVSEYTAQYDDATTPRAEPQIGETVLCDERPDGRELDAFLRRAREAAGCAVYLDCMGDHDTDTGLGTYVIARGDG